MTTKTNLEVQDEYGYGNLDDVGGWDSNLGDDPTTAFSYESFGDAGINDLGISCLQSDSLDISDSVEFASGFDLELSSLEATIIQLAKGKITGSRGHPAAASSQKVYITHEDFEEGPERDAFLLIYGHAEILFCDTKETKFDPEDLPKMRAIDFFFCRSIGGLHLDDAVNCIDDNIRTDVILLRFMLEFWIRGWKLPAMPVTATNLPERIEVTAATKSGIVGIKLAQIAWFQPGIEASELMSLACQNNFDAPSINEVKKALNELVCDYILSIKDGHVYTTGKNPILELEDRINDPTLSNRNVLANLHWSRKF